MSNALYIILNVVYATSRDMDNVGFTNRYISASANTQAQIRRSGASWRNMGSRIQPSRTISRSSKNAEINSNALSTRCHLYKNAKSPLNVQSDSILAKRTHKLKFFDREPHGETWGRESNPHGQFLGPQKMQK